MKVLEFIKTVISKVWKFSTMIFTICLIASLVLFALSILMPDNATKAVEIIKNL